jgi:hypothetical protein
MAKTRKEVDKVAPLPLHTDGKSHIQPITTPQPPNNIAWEAGWNEFRSFVHLALIIRLLPIPIA